MFQLDSMRAHSESAGGSDVFRSSMMEHVRKADRNIWMTCWRWRVFCLVLAVLSVPDIGRSFSVLSHEAIVDSLWDPAIKPLLLQRFPDSTAEQLQQARAYAYGGCIIQDLGYYPFGSHLFTNLVHYVRSGDFVMALLRDAQDENDYAFALGSMAHYFSDTIGHPLAINPSVPLRYPRLHQKFGDDVTYAEAPKEHVLVEFSFDVVQVAGGAYLPQAYHDFIGFQVDQPLLERAFLETYGIQMKDVFVSEDLAIGSYRYAVAQLIPDATRAAWTQERKQIQKLTPGVERDKFIFRMSRKDYERQYGQSYERPGFGARLIGFLLRLIPKIGPFRTLAFKPPLPKMEALFLQSFQSVHQRYGQTLQQMHAGDPVVLANEDFDTGNIAWRGEYSLADETYAELLDKLAGQKFAGVSPELRANIFRFYADPSPVPVSSKKGTRRWRKTHDELNALRMATPAQAD
jgi:hypothetical protein